MRSGWLCVSASRRPSGTAPFPPRSSPTGSAVYWAIRAGKLKPNPRLGAWTQVAGFGSLAYVLGKISYIVGQNCMDIFLEQAPNIVVSERVRRRRNISEDDKYLLAANSSAVTRQRFADILEYVNPEDMTEKEVAILDDCDSVAFYQYSLPLAAAGGGTVYAAIEKGWLAPGRRFPRLPRLPRVLAGSSQGFLAGQYLYIYTSDCTDRFQQYDPEGNIARLLRAGYIREQKQVLEEEERIVEPQGYYLPGEEKKTLRQNIEKEWGESCTLLKPS
jgi:hypothetical protein